jgi:hypothetical protein
MSSNAITPVLLIHGTYAALDPKRIQWYEPDSDFCRALDGALAKLEVNARCWATMDRHSAPFKWSGENDWLSRHEAASRLHDLIRSFNGHCHIVAHSHGGNVALQAIQMAPSRFHGSLTLLGTPLILREERQRRYAPLVYSLVASALVIAALRSNLSRAAILWSIGGAILTWVVARVARGLDDMLDFNFGGGSILQPLYISSKEDEAFRLLEAVVRSPDPFLQNQKPRPSWKTRVQAVVDRAWTEVTAGQPPFTRRHVVTGAALLALAMTLGLAATLGIWISPPYLFWGAWAQCLLLVMLMAKRSKAKPRAINVTVVLNVLLAFAIQLARYPLTQLGVRLARKTAWPFLKMNALGLSGAPGSIDSVTIAMVPPERKWSFHEFKPLPEDLVALVKTNRQQSSEQTFSDAIVKIWRSEWSPEGIREILAQLNHPDLVHSCYYQYLDHGWVLTEIAENVAYTEYVQNEDADALVAQADREDARNAYKLDAGERLNEAGGYRTED